MRLTDEQVMQDNKRFANCNALAELKYCGWDIPHRRSITNDEIHFYAWLCRSAVALLREQEKKEIKLHKKHVITWKRDDEFTMRKLYEAVCETLMDEGELVIVRIDDHEKVDFTFYVTHEDTYKSNDGVK